MAIVINANDGSISGLSVGGLPDGTVDAGTVAADVATQAEIDAKLALAGGTMSGALNITLADNTDTLTLTSTDADAAVGPVLRLNRDSGSPAASDLLGSIIFQADDDGGNSINFVEIITQMEDASAGSRSADLYLKTRTNGSLVSRIGMYDSTTVINDDGADIDFRVESDTNANALFVDGATGYVGIGTTASAIIHHYVLTSLKYGCYLGSDHISGEAFTSHMTNASFTGKALNLNVEASAGSGWNFATMYSTSSADLEFQMRGDGEAYCDGSWSGSGADYAEYFEWADGNPNDEDRRGIAVVLESEKIRPAVNGEDPFGVISGRPAVVGDTDIGRWKQKHLRDDFGSYVLEPYTVTEWEAQEVDVLGEGDTETTYKTVQHSYESDKIPEDITVPEDVTTLNEDANGASFERRKLNPDWNSETEYVSREDRPEWDTVGLMGKVRILKGQPVGSRWIKMRDVSDTVEEWLIR